MSISLGKRDWLVLDMGFLGGCVDVLELDSNDYCTILGVH